MADAGFELLPIAVAHARAAGLIAAPHRDPFDRLLAAQATSEGLVLVTADRNLGPDPYRRRLDSELASCHCYRFTSGCADNGQIEPGHHPIACG
ncbi:MAG: PIN domain-containing protein [Hyphomicrobiaceae bacterium]